MNTPIGIEVAALMLADCLAEIFQVTDGELAQRIYEAATAGDDQARAGVSVQASVRTWADRYARLAADPTVLDPAPVTARLEHSPFAGLAERLRR